jgi:hypothetical protein
MTYFLQVRTELAKLIFEKPTYWQIIEAWAFLIMIFIAELYLPTIFGSAIDGNHYTFSGWFVISAGALYWMDKLGLLLAAYCFATVLIDIVIPYASQR